MSADDDRARLDVLMLHLIYTNHDLILSRQHDRTWQDIQHHDYITSLGPWSAAEMIDFLQAEYPDLQPSAHEQVAALLASGKSACAIGFSAETERAVALLSPQAKSNR